MCRHARGAKAPSTPLDWHPGTGGVTKRRRCAFQRKKSYSRVARAGRAGSKISASVRFWGRLARARARARRDRDVHFPNLFKRFARNTTTMSEDLKECPSCESPYGYATGENQYTCPECSFEWTIEPTPTSSDELIVMDCNGVQLQTGDSVVVIKDLPVKGMPKSIKSGTKVKNIRLTYGDHNIDCKIEGFGAMGLKSEFVKKA